VTSDWIESCSCLFDWLLSNSHSNNSCCCCCVVVVVVVVAAIIKKKMKFIQIDFIQRLYVANRDVRQSSTRCRTPNRRIIGSGSDVGVLFAGPILMTFFSDPDSFLVL
jgi:hypothetical protein